MSRICEINLNEMNELLVVGEGYFTLDVKTSWSRLRNEYEKGLMM